MKKAIVSVCTLISVLLMLFTPVYATSNFVNVEYNIDYTQSSVTINGVTDVLNSRIMFVVANPQKNLSDIEEDAKSGIQYQREIVTDSEGNFSHKFTLNIAEDTQSDEDVVYDVYVKAFGGHPYKAASITYKSARYRIELLKKLKGSAVDVLEVLEDSESIKCIGLDSLSLTGELDKERLSQLLVGQFDLYADTVDGFKEAIVRLRGFCVVQLLNQGDLSAVFDDDGNYLLMDFFDIEKCDSKNKTTFYECYKTIMSKQKMPEVSATLIQQQFKNPEELFRLFSVNTMLISLTNPEVSGYGHVEKILTADNISFIGLNLNKSVDSNVQAKIASHNGFNSVKELEDFINELKFHEEGDNDKPSSSKGSSGGFGPIKVKDDFVEQPETQDILFVDVPENHWAFAAITYLRAKGVVNGVDDKHFSPDALVTREQLVKMIFAISKNELANTDEMVFEDVPRDSWCAPYVITAYRAGYINGISERVFGLGKYATRQEVCTIICRMLGMTTTSKSNFSDNGDISSWAQESVAALSNNGIVTGYPDGSFLPKSCCTRAEVATMIYKAAAYMEVE